MGLLQDKDKQALKEHFKNLSKPVKLINFTQEMECQYCRDTRTLLEEVAELSDQISVEVYDFVKDKNKVEQYGIERIPAVVVLSESDKDNGIRFYGIPAGYEFVSLMEAIMEAGGKKSELSQETVSTLKAIKKPVHIQVMVSLTCPYCPAAVRTAHMFAMASENIRADMVEVSEFPNMAVKYNVSGVPKIIINENTSFTGAQPEKAYLQYVLSALEEKKSS